MGQAEIPFPWYPDKTKKPKKTTLQTLRRSFQGVNWKNITIIFGCCIRICAVQKIRGKQIYKFNFPLFKSIKGYRLHPLFGSGHEIYFVLFYFRYEKPVNANGFYGTPSPRRPYAKIKLTINQDLCGFNIGISDTVHKIS